VKSEPADIKIVSYSHYDDPMGGVIVVGEVENTGANTIHEVTLTGTVTTTEGSTIDGGTRVWVIDLLPNQRAPFYMYFTPQFSGNPGQSQIIPEVSNIQLVVAAADKANEHQYQDLTVTDRSSSTDSTSENKGTYWVTGTLKNTGSQTAGNVRILATFYNSAGRVVAVGGYTSEVLATSLAASASTSFKIGAWDQNQTEASADMKIQSYTLLVQAETPIQQGNGPQVTPFPTVDQSAPTQTASPTNSDPAYTQSPDSGNNPTSTPDSTDNSAATPTWVYAVVVLVVVAAIAGAFLAVKKRKSAGTVQPQKTGANKKSRPKSKA
jgi:hypothetical protein